MKKRQLIFSLACILIIAGVLFHFFILQNQKVLFLIGAGLDKPSMFYNIVIKRIYILSERPNFEEEIRQHLQKDENDHLLNLYIHVFGIIGEKRSAGLFIKVYSRYQHDTTHRSTVNQVIDAMGLVADEDLIRPFLEILLRDYDKLRVQATKYSIVRSLYLLTGTKYFYVDDAGRNAELEVTEELVKARNVILDSEKRKRTLSEKLLLEKLYGPPRS